MFLKGEIYTLQANVATRLRHFVANESKNSQIEYK